MPLAKSIRRRPVPLMKPSPPRQHPLTKLPLAISIMAFLAMVAVIVGTMAAISMQRDDDMLRASLEQSQQHLLTRIQRLEESCLVPSRLSPSTSALPITVTAKELNEMRVRINTNDWNSTTTTETTDVRDTQRNIAFRLPYNPKWGNEMYKIAPFEVEENVTRFGPIPNPKDDESFHRRFAITILPISDREVTSVSGVTVRAKRLGGFDVQITQGADGNGELRFEGKKYIYLLTEVSDSGNSMTSSSYEKLPMNDATALAILRTLRSI